MNSPRAKIRRLRLRLFLSFALALAVLAVMKALPYASFLMVDTDVGIAVSDPSHGFSIGPLRWDVEKFSSAPELAPFRRYFFETCKGKTGAHAAMCLSRAFDHAFPAGRPQHEFLERRFDPAADFEAHLLGQPGHCVNRCAMLATSLLSVGIPARVVSFSPRSGRGGHTLVEVWTGADWTAVDPTELGLVGSFRPNSARELRMTPGVLRLFTREGRLRQGSYLLSDSVARGEVVYPEPWLYTRIGPRFSFWPFRGKFVQAGMYNWRFSTPLLLCRVAFVISALACLYFLVGLLFTKSRVRAAEPKLSPEPEPETELALGAS